MAANPQDGNILNCGGAAGGREGKEIRRLEEDGRRGHRSEYEGGNERKIKTRKETREARTGRKEGDGRNGEMKEN